MIKFNIDQTGLYVVNYFEDQWIGWIKNLNDPNKWNKLLNDLDRNNLLLDAFYLARSGSLSYEKCLQLAEYLKYEDSLIVWTTAFGSLDYLQKFMLSGDDGIAFNNWIKEKFINQIYEKFAWKEIDHNDLNQKRLQQLVIDMSCTFKHSGCLQIVNERFDRWMNNVTDLVDPDLFSIILYHTMANNATEEKFKFVKQKYSEALTTNKKLKYLRALSAVQNQSMLIDLIENSMSSNYLRSQDFFTFMFYLSSNKMGRKLGWTFYKENYTKISKRFGLDDSNLGRAIYEFANYFHTEESKQDVLDFFAQNPNAGASLLYRQQTIDLIEANIRWLNRHYETVYEYFVRACDSKICPWKNFRLNRNVRPLQYDLTIQIDTDSFRYNGTVKIKLNITSNDIKHIILHTASTLNISTIEIKNIENNQRISILNNFQYNPLEFHIISLKEIINPDVYFLRIDFNGSALNNDENGLYRGWYSEENSELKTNLIASQFQSTYARKAFPCFDEPTFKSLIAVTVIHPKRMQTTLSNMEIESSIPHASMSDWSITSFKITPPMVTYLIAILVSDFDCYQSNTTLYEIPIRTCSAKTFAANKTDYSLSVTPKILKYYENLTNIEYPLQKLDQIALPQFASGAMENWGLIKYREKNLLWSSDQDQSSDLKRVCSVISHELAHNWFGNLVTSEFWGDLWLNEAFASYMEYGAIDSVHPDWNIWNTMTLSDSYSAIINDFGHKSLALVRNITNPSEIASTNGIVYNKGSHVLKMFEKTMGTERFYRSIQQYLQEHKYKTATTGDLFDFFDMNWSTIESKSRSFLESWTMQPGFPYLNITYNSTNDRYYYVQERFFYDGSEPSEE